MRLEHPRRAGRRAFTLVELLVVCAIIAVLVSLTTAAVMKFLAKGPEVQNVNDIHQLEAAIAAFHRDFKLGTEYFPSRLKLCMRYTDYNTSQPGLDRDSLGFLQRMFPRLWKDAASQATVVDWTGHWSNGQGKIDPPVVLEGDQCLVFFLGGAGGVNGFSASASNPAAVGGARKGPYFNFDSTRLAAYPGHAAVNGFVYPSYYDVYGYKNGTGKPYAYFSSYTSRNGYNRYGSTDCPALGVSPFIASLSPTVQYVYPDKFQIISAGSDGVFGPGGGPWSPATAAQSPAIKINGKTIQGNQANFYQNFLDIPTLN
jgi:prepilin-type N-terminal cleavage/methylation domain-containing protein